MMQRVLFYVQSLLGRGHLVRAAHLCNALQQGGGGGGFEVLLADGGGDFPPLHSGIQRLRLPAVRSSDIGFSKLLKADGSALNSADKEVRKHMLFSAYKEFSPDIIICESYPLSRRAFAFELDGMLEHAGDNNVLRLCSVRDIVVFDGSPEKQQRILQKLSLIDRVWVHGDENFCPLTESLPFADVIKDKIAYSGYIAGEFEISEAAGEGQIIVSGGGGAAAEALYLGLLPLAQKLPQYRWRFLVGENFPNRQKFLQQKMPSHIAIAENTPDFRALLKGATLTIGQAGYNTVMDILAIDVPCLLQPFAGIDGTETEQPLRARLLHQHGRAEILPEDLSSLDAEELAGQIEKTITQQGKVPLKIASAGELSGQLQKLWKRHVE